MDLYRYVWQVSGRRQIILLLLSVAVFMLDLVPLELQRRIINGALAHHALGALGLLCALYAGVVLLQGGIKLMLNIFQGSVSESVNRQLRLETSPAVRTDAAAGIDAGNEGVEISIVVSEVEAVGGFVGTCVSDPVLHGGVLLSVFGYMLFLEPWMGLVAFLIFVPQFVIVPLLQDAINRRTQARIKTMRALRGNIVKDAVETKPTRSGRGYRAHIRRIYDLNMQIFRRKFGMNFIMNLLHQLGIVGVLFVGGWFVAVGRTEVAFLSGLNRVNDPWGDLVNYFRDMTNARVKFRLIAKAIGRVDAPAA